MVFDPHEHVIEMKRRAKKKEKDPKSGREIDVYEDVITEYLPVLWRIYWFRLENPKGTIKSLPLTIDTEKGVAVFETYAEREDGGNATMHGSETIGDWKDFIEKAETKATGRTLAAVGYGSQFADEDFNEGERIVDSPVDRPSSDKEKKVETTSPPSSSKGKVAPAVPTIPAEPEKLATSEQIAQISSLCEASGVYEWKHLLSLAKKLPESVEKWTERQAAAFIASTEGWPRSPMQQEWVAKIASKEQIKAVMAFCQPEQYGTTAVLALRDRLDDTKGVKSENFTNGMVDHLLAYLLAAKETVERAKQLDKQFTMAKALGVSHPLDFYAAGEAQEQGLTTYLTKLNLLDPPKKQEQQTSVAA